jgi:hypothetical protein
MIKITTAAAIVLSIVAAFALNEMLEFGVDRLQFATGLATVLVAVAGLAAVLQEREEEEEALSQSQHLNGTATPASKLLNYLFTFSCIMHCNYHLMRSSSKRMQPVAHRLQLLWYVTFVLSKA